ncbi:LytTR family DNA-binding domain-containing protein [Marivivens donghaensis]|uniref:LytTR family DNA-binding domain-containing protein n=1 Tax=Marivivens donghaensis TaxID=1699413 RepID=UPI003F6A4F95
MTKDKKKQFFRVVCSSGDSFYTSAQSATDFVLDPVFVQFMVFSVFLFTSLTMALSLPLVPQIILFGAGIVSTFFTLSICITVYLGIIQVIGTRTIYTPLLLLPMQLANTLVLDYVLKTLGTSYVEGFAVVWEIGIRTLIIIVCLDVFHGKFVAPRHGLTVVLDGDGNPVPQSLLAPVQPVVRQGTVPAAPQGSIGTGRSDQSPMPLDEDQEESMSANDGAQEQRDRGTAQSDPDRLLQVSRQTFDLDAIQYIKSEDHYLVIQYSRQSEMIRGRLSEVAARIELRRGLLVNRSVWVSYAAITDVVETATGQLSVTLEDGAVFKVANSRKKLFEHGCNEYASGIQIRRALANE